MSDFLGEQKKLRELNLRKLQEYRKTIDRLIELERQALEVLEGKEGPRIIRGQELTSAEQKAAYQRARREPKVVLPAKPKGVIILTDKQRPTLRAIFGLDGREYSSMREIALVLSFTRGNIYDQREWGLKKIKKVLTGNIDITTLPEPDGTFYVDLAKVHPGKSYEDLKKIAYRFRGEERQGRKPKPKAVIPKPETEPEPVPEPAVVPKKEPAVPEPSSMALKPLWAALLHPDGASLEKTVLMRRTTVSEAGLRAFIDGSLRALQEVWEGKREPLEPELTSMCQGLQERYPGKTLQEIIAAVPRDIKLKFLGEVEAV